MQSTQAVPPTADEAAVRAELSLLLFGFMRTQALAAAAKLGVADLLENGPASAGTIAGAVGADEASLYRLLRFLTINGVFDELADEMFAQNRLSSGLRSSAPLSMRYIAIAMGSEQYEAWSDALHSFMTGEPAFQHKFGKPYFDYLADNPEASANFNRAMAAGVRARIDALVDFDWSRHTTVADIGGGTGTAIAAVLSANPHLRGKLFDLPSVVVAAAAVLAQAGVNDRCEVIGGDFFSDPVPPADAYVLAQILHDWNDERAAAILRNCRQSIADGGRLLIIDGIVPPEREPGFLQHMDLHMLVLIGGKERSEYAWDELLSDAGFKRIGVTPAGPAHLIQARPV